MKRLFLSRLATVILFSASLASLPPTTLGNDTNSASPTINKFQPVSPEDQFQLGRSYHRGEGVPQSFEQAYYWYNRAAKSGNIKAMHNLGIMYLDGIGVPKDDGKGYALLLESAKKGDPRSQYTCGMMLCQGRGVVRDCKKGVSWLQKASISGNLDAKVRIAQDLLFGDDAVEKNVSAAVPLLTECSEKGNGWASGTLGLLYRDGYGVTMNKEKSRELLKRGSLLGDPKSMMELAFELSDEDPCKAYPFLKLASERITNNIVLDNELLRTRELMKPQEIEAGNVAASMLDKIIKGVNGIR
ncbi:MAG: tetratricopeptide repeat protein [Methylococcaceae bacterium]